MDSRISRIQRRMPAKRNILATVHGQLFLPEPTIQPVVIQFIGFHRFSVRPAGPAHDSLRQVPREIQTAGDSEVEGFLDAFFKTRRNGR